MERMVVVPLTVGIDRDEWIWGRMGMVLGAEVRRWRWVGVHAETGVVIVVVKVRSPTMAARAAVKKTRPPVLAKRRDWLRFSDVLAMVVFVCIDEGVDEIDFLCP